MIERSFVLSLSLSPVNNDWLLLMSDTERWMDWFLFINTHYWKAKGDQSHSCTLHVDVLVLSHKHSAPHILLNMKLALTKIHFFLLLVRVGLEPKKRTVHCVRWRRKKKLSAHFMCKSLRVILSRVQTVTILSVSRIESKSQEQKRFIDSKSTEYRQQ